MLDIILLDGLEYQIMDNNEIYKLVNNELIPPSKKDMKNIKKHFKKNIFKSKKLNKIASSNIDIKKIDYIIPILEQIEKAIPNEYSSLLYKNISNLKMFFSSERIIDDRLALYDVLENELVISKPKYDDLKLEYSSDKFTLLFQHMLRHELLHLSSNNVDYKLFSSVDFLDLGIKHSDAFAEGVTELYTSQFDKMHYGYRIEMDAITQLSYIISPNIIAEVYFEDLGIIPIVSELNTIINNSNLGKLLFDSLDNGLNYNLNNNIRFENQLIAQSILLKYISEKCKILDKEENYLELEELLEVLQNTYIKYDDRIIDVDYNNVFDILVDNDTKYNEIMNEYSLKQKNNH